MAVKQETAEKIMVYEWRFFSGWTEIDFNGFFLYCVQHPAVSEQTQILKYAKIYGKSSEWKKAQLLNDTNKHSFK